MSRQRSLVVLALGFAISLLLGSGIASATTLTSPTGTVATPTVKAESEGVVTLDLSELPKIECESKVEGTVDISASIPFHSGSLFCGSGATTWTGSLEVTSPSALYVDEA